LLTKNKEEAGLVKHEGHRRRRREEERKLRKAATGGKKKKKRKKRRERRTTFSLTKPVYHSTENSWDVRHREQKCQREERRKRDD